MNNPTPLHSAISLVGSLWARLCANYRIALLLFASIPAAAAFSLNGYNWPAGSQITLHLQLSRPPVVLQDGSSSWNASTADALALWNQYLDTVSFVQGPGSGPAADDGSNSVFFSDTIYADPFPTGVLAVTLNYSHTAGAFTETDVIFNNSIKWNSYRGPIQGSGATATWDLHRVALHEFGHVLGLAHPDEHGQVVTAIMNSTISNLDQLTADDIAGARFLYGARITSSLSEINASAGDSFAYQITANNNPSSFAASGLPPGLQLDPTSGLISGTLGAAGTFDVLVIAHGPVKDVSGAFRIVVAGPTITSSRSLPPVEFEGNFSYQITASRAASSYDATGLPPGLSLNKNSGLITGNPVAAGTFDATVVAHTSYGDATDIVQIVVLPPRITSNLFVPGLEIGGNFSYQITVSGHASSFSASNLPAGLRIDRTTGVISGIPTLSGDHSFTVTAHFTYGDVSAEMRIFVKALAPADIPLAKIPLSSSVNALIADPYRPRVYAANYLALNVIDVESLKIIKTISLPFHAVDLCVSADGTKLWMATNSTTVGRIDLENLTLLESLTIAEPAERIREGLNQRLYISSVNGDVAQIDSATGAVRSRFNPEIHEYASHCAIETSPDRKTLYVANLVDIDQRLARYDISTSTPVLKQSLPLGSEPSSSFLSVSHDGQLICLSGFQTVPVRSTANLSVTLGSLNLGAVPGPSAFAADDSLLFQTSRPTRELELHRIVFFDTHSFQPTRTIILPDSVTHSLLAVDSTNSYLFVYTHTYHPESDLSVFPVHPEGPPPAPKSLLNVSTRLRVQTQDDVLIGGFILQGTAPKKVVLRAMGPSMAVGDPLADPTLTLYNSAGKIVASNDNWNARRQTVLATGLAPANEHEAVIVTSLPAGAYTMAVRGVRGTTGVGLVELYDIDSTHSRLANISTRGKIETGDNVMIGGFIIGSNEATKVIVRAIGPSLSKSGVAGALEDPVLELYNGNGSLMTRNDDWRTLQEAVINSTQLPPGDNRESAIVATLQPGNYTAIVRGKNDKTGIGLVEVYNLESN